MKRPLAYLTAAWSGEPDVDMELAAHYCRLAYEAGFSPICPLLYLPLFLNDSVPEEHKAGIDMRRDIQNYFDYEAYGRDVRINEGGVFAPGGYVSAIPEGFKEYYHGPQDIPPEHRIFAYPEKAEPVHSILAALKRFQEAPPAPKKDKAGPSHEER